MDRYDPYTDKFIRDATDKNVGTTISRQAAIEAVNSLTYPSSLMDVKRKLIELPPTEPKRETATVSVGISRGGVTMWYECDACGEPVDQGDTFCSGCGRRLIHE